MVRKIRSHKWTHDYKEGVATLEKLSLLSPVDGTSAFRAFEKLHKFLTMVMGRLKQLEDDPVVPAKYVLIAKALRWDWEEIEKKR